MTWDDDISAMSLSDLQKNGLQVFRNYRRSFDQELKRRFLTQEDAAPTDLSAFLRLIGLLAVEDSRYLPVIFCAYADDLLGNMFSEMLPSDIPGGRKGMLAWNGALGHLAARIQASSAFNLLSQDLLVDLERLRKARNQISHSWSVAEMNEMYSRQPLSEIQSIASLNADHELSEALSTLSSEKLFRVKIIWIAARITYEIPLYWKAKNERIDPNSCLYVPPVPKVLGHIVEAARDATLRLAIAN